MDVNEHEHDVLIKQNIPHRFNHSCYIYPLRIRFFRFEFLFLALFISSPQQHGWETPILIIAACRKALKSSLGSRFYCRKKRKQTLLQSLVHSYRVVAFHSQIMRKCLKLQDLTLTRLLVLKNCKVSTVVVILQCFRPFY